MTPELSKLIREVREDKDRLQLELRRMGERQTDALVRTMVLGTAGAACDPPLSLDLPTDELCERCLTARGPFDRGLDRRMLRERACMHLCLSRGSFALRSGDDLLAIWDDVTRHEPLIRQFVNEPRWRTEADGTPFTGAKMAAIYGARPLAPGDETADPADIPELVSEMVSFAARDDLPPELIAFAMPYLVFRIHPFVDGNGHVMRMLACVLLHSAGYPEPALIVYVDLFRKHRKEICLLSRDVSLGRASTTDHVILHMNLLLGAQRAVLEMLRKPRAYNP